VEACLTLCGAIRNTWKCMEYKLQPLTIISKINVQYNTQNLSLAWTVALEGWCWIIWEWRSESEFTLHKILIPYLQPQQEQWRFNCVVIPLLSHILSSKAEAFIVPWNKLFCSLLTEVHTSLLSLKLWPPWLCVSSANRL